MGDDSSDAMSSLVSNDPADPDTSTDNTSQSNTSSTAAGRKFTEEMPEHIDTNSPWFWPDDIVNENEEVIEAVNPHPIRSIIPYAAGAAFLVMALYFIILEFQGRSDEFVNNLIPLIEVTAPEQFWLLPAILLTVGGGVIIAEYIRRRLTWLIITDKNLYIRRNILFRNVSDFEDKDINKISQDDPWPLKRLGIGHIKIFTASTDVWEAQMMYIPNPSEIRSAIRTELESDES